MAQEDPCAVAPVHEDGDVVDEITEEVVRTIGVEIPEYARPADETYTHVINRGVAQALEGFLARLSGTGSDAEDVRATYRRIGKGRPTRGAVSTRSRRRCGSAPG